jgi:SRSO17 transposase
MDAGTVLEIRPALTAYLRQFDDCFARRQTREHLIAYVQGQLGDLPRKSVEPMADAAGMPPRTLQEFLSLSKWDESMMRDRLQRQVAARHAHPQAVGIIDETSYIKKGDKTACVQRQHCGAAGKTENCVVSVHLGYATPEPLGELRGFHTLLDGGLYLPEQTWHEARQRCREAGIPDDLVYRPKWRIALEQYRRALVNGVRFAWLTFDEGYGGKPPFLRELDGLGQNYVGEVPRDFRVWTSPPPVLHRAHGRDQAMGRPRKYPRLKVKHNPTVGVEGVVRHSPLMRSQAWTRYRVKDASQGPMVWEVKHLPVYLPDEHGLPTRAHHLLVARSVTDPNQVKYFISNAPPDTPVEVMLLVAFSRWKIERMFEDSKMELGMDHFEVRNFGSISRHLILTCVSHLFLAEFHQKHAGGNRGGKPGPDRQPIGHGNGETGPDMDAGRTLLAAAGRSDRGAIDANTGTQRRSRPQPPQGHDPETARLGRETQERASMLLASVVAL